MTTTPDQKRAYFERLDAGFSSAAAARAAGISERTGARLRGSFIPQSTAGRELRERREQDALAGPRSFEDLPRDAQIAFDDFAYFQRRYMGRIAMPFQVESAETFATAIKDLDNDDFIDINAPPGVGKTTTFTLDIPAWITVRDRTVRGLLGSGVEKTAKAYVRNLRQMFERTIPIKAEPRELAAGRAVDAIATLAGDFGRFKPLDRDVWSSEQFTVAQPGGISTVEKEPTWSAYGRDGGVLGMRFDFVMWDDLVQLKRLRTDEMVEEDRIWYIDVAEARLEPGGVFALNGQRLGSNDLHRFALDMVEYSEEVDLDELEEMSDEEVLEVMSHPKYKHLKFKAHYDELCVGNHGRNAPPYGEPGGCLLFPSRLSYRKLKTIQLNRSDSYEVVYQQGDVDAEDVLVQKAWVTGGTVAGEYFPGCWDKDRDRLEIPAGVDLSQCMSIATADPSPTKFWSIQWWLYDPVNDLRFLLDLERKKMGANDFLDYLLLEQRFSGHMEEWQQTSIAMGIPISHWIVETNAAQKFLLQYDHVHKWIARRQVQIIPHDTHRNKSDEHFGVQTIGSKWKFGQVRLPGKNGSLGRVAALKLVEEATHYPNTTTNDCVMAEWFFEWQLPHLYRPKRESPPPRNPVISREEARTLRALAGVGF